LNKWGGWGRKKDKEAFDEWSKQRTRWKKRQRVFGRRKEKKGYVNTVGSTPNEEKNWRVNKKGPNKKRGVDCAKKGERILGDPQTTV